MPSPEVKILGHIDLLKYVHQTLLFSRSIHPVRGAYRDYLGVLTVIKIMASKKSNNRALGNKNHIPTSSKLNKS